MADYNVTSSDGTFTVNVQTGTINNNYDIPFIGQDAINYGDDLVAAQLRQLENFSNTSAPAFGTTRVKGQLWYDSTPVTGRLSVFDGSSWDVIPLDIDVVHTSGAENIDDVKTFTSAPLFSAAGAPISVNSNTVVPNLNADLLDDLHATAFATSAQGILATNAEPSLPANAAGDGFVLSADLSNNYTWVSLSVAAGDIQVDTAQLPTGGNIVFVDSAHGDYGTGVQPPLTAAGITYNAATSTLSTLNFVGTFSGSLSGNADTATTTTTATNATNISINSNTGAGDSTTFPVLVGLNSATSQVPLVDGAQLSYDATSGELTAASFAGAGSLITALNMTTGPGSGTLDPSFGGTGVGAATGTGSLFALQDSPVFTTEIQTPKVASTAAVNIEYNGVNSIRTQLRTTDGNTSAAEVLSHSNNWYDIGFNVLPQFNWDTTDTLEAQHCGHLTGHSDGAAHTLTLPTSGVLDFPVGGVTTIINGSATDYTITDTASATLFYIEPGVGGTDTVGGCTVGAGGAATLYRFAADTFYIWGSEITV